MSDERRAGGGSGETLIFTCAGASHCGQVANRAGVKLASLGAGSLFCVAAVGAGVTDKLERSRHAARRVAIDGCDDHCCRKVLEREGLGTDIHVVVTELGIEKSPARASVIGDSRKVVDHVKARLAYGRIPYV